MSYFFVLPIGHLFPTVKAMSAPMSPITEPMTVSQGNNETSMVAAVSPSTPLVPVVSAIFCAAAPSGLRITLMVAHPIVTVATIATMPMTQRPILRAMDSAAPATTVTKAIAVMIGEASWPEDRRRGVQGN